MTEQISAAEAAEIKKLNALKRQGAITEQEYSALLEKTLHPNSTWRKVLDFQSLSPAEKKKKIMLIMLTLGILSILTGLGLIIGANWSFIPYSVKLGGALALLAGSLAGSFYCHTNNHPNIKELFLAAGFLLIAGNMAIIQQFMQLSLNWHQGSAIWWGLSLPIVLLSKKKWLPIASTILFVFGIWELIERIFDWLNYMAISGILATIVFASFLGGQKASMVRKIAFTLGMLVLFVGDIHTEDIAGLIANVILILFMAGLPKTAQAQVRFCNYLAVFIVFRIFVLFFTAYHNLMSMGIQMVIFGTVLLAIAGGYYYFFDDIQQAFKRLTDDEK